MCIFSCFGCNRNKKFQNWSSNINNSHVQIHYVENDDDIRRIIEYAKNNDKIIRVAGSKHSISPAVCNSNENNIIIITLEKYNLYPKNLIVDNIHSLITVNAGWKLGDLYNELEKLHCNYFLETQTATSAFSIGGISCMPVHGSRLGGGVIPDSIVGMTLIDQNGHNVTKKSTDDDFDMYRINMGILGVVTSVTFKVNQVNHINASVTTFNNIFSYNTHKNMAHFDAHLFDDYYKDIIQKCINANPDHIEYYHSFIDYHNDNILAINWKNDPYDSKHKVDFISNDANATNVSKIPSLDVFLKDIDQNYRRNSTLLSILNQVARYSIQADIESNSHGNRDMFWVTSAIDSYFMAYFIPIYINGEYKLDNLYNAIAFVKNTMNEFKNDNCYFNIDLPSDLRFVVSSNQSQLSPIYSDNNKNVYAVLELVCGSTDIELNNNKINYCNRNINRDFRRFVYQIEQKWLSLGGVPHWAKLFGFAKPNGDAFDVQALKNIFSSDLKKKLRDIAQPLFVNQFVNDLLFEG